MKKFLSVILICFIFIGQSVCAFCAQDRTQSVLEVVKQRIGDTSEYESFDSSMQTRYGITQYFFTWRTEDDQSGEYKSVDVTACEDGTITSYSSYDSSKRDFDNNPSLKKITTSEAMLYAKKAADALNPSLSDEVVVYSNNRYESLSDSRFTFRIKRVKDGVEVYGDTGYITIDADTLCLDQYSFNYTQNLVFPSKEKAIDVQKAKESYEKNIGMELVYMRSYKAGSEGAYLAYVPKTHSEYINALTGEAIEPIYPQNNLHYNYADKEMAQDSLASGSVSNNRFTEAEIQELERHKELLTLSQIESMLKSNKLLQIGAEFEISSSSLTSDKDDNYFYSLTFNHDDEYIYVNLSAKDGEIFSYVYSDKGGQHTDKVADEKLVKEYVAKLSPKHYKEDDSGEYRLQSNKNGNYRFVRYINDIPFYSNLITIYVDAKTSRLVNYSLTYHDLDFPLPDNIMSHHDACMAYTELAQYDLCYYPSCSKEGMSNFDTALLVYKTDDAKSNEIDAVTGELISYYDEAIIGNYTDISGHYAQDIINTLATYGIGFEDDEFQPDKVITQKEYVALLIAALQNRGDIILRDDLDYTYYCNRAESDKIILPSEKAPDSLVTRSLGAVYMVRAMGYDEVASLEGIYVCSFDDVKTNTGYISILNAMGVVNGYGDNFYPEKPLTRADTMIMIYNYLSR